MRLHIFPASHSNHSLFLHSLVYVGAASLYKYLLRVQSHVIFQDLPEDYLNIGGAVVSSEDINFWCYLELDFRA